MSATTLESSHCRGVPAAGIAHVAEPVVALPVARTAVERWCSSWRPSHARTESWPVATSP